MGLADKETLDRSIREQLPSGLRLAIRLTGDPVAAEDLMQEALLRVAGSWTSYRGEASFRTWFTRILINVFRDQLRSRSGEQEPLLDLAGDGLTDRNATPVQAAMGKELAQLVAQLVSALPARQREVIVLTTYEGFSVTDAAQLLETSEANIHATRHQARRRLRKLLQPYFAENEK